MKIKMSPNRKLMIFCIVMVFFALLSGRFRPSDEKQAASIGASSEKGVSRPITGNNVAKQFGTALADAVERVMPSVVVVRTEGIQIQYQRDFFGFTYRIPKRLAGQGSGVIIDKQGYVLTGYHVVKGARQVEVVLNDETKLPARVVGTDAITDVAVLKIDSDLEFEAIEIGDSDAVRVGELAIAIGSPFSLQSSVTVGFVSHKGRRVDILPYEDFIQTDAAINPGNSGGPLVDVDGKLIGINSAIKTSDDGKGNVGIAFAIPVNLAMTVGRSLQENGYHEWPWVGASFGEMDPQVRKQYFDGAGVPIVEVWRDTPAAQANLLPGDVILEVEGKEVVSEYDIYRAIYSHQVGEVLRFTIWREEQKFEVELGLKALPDRFFR